MTLDQIIKIQSIIDKRAIRSDTLEFLDKERYSDSLKKTVRYGDMHIDHFLNVFLTSKLVDTCNETTLEDSLLMISELLKKKYTKRGIKRRIYVNKT